MRIKVAVTDLLALIVTVSGLALPVMAPSQPVNNQPVAGVAARVTTVLTA